VSRTGRVSVNVGFQRALRYFEKLHDARVRVHEGIRTKQVLLFCDGVEVDPAFFESHLQLHVDDKVDPPRAEIQAIRSLERPAAHYKWMLGTEGLSDLCRSGNPRGAGAKRVYDREKLLIEAAALAIEKGLPEGAEALVHELQQVLGGKAPGDTLGKRIIRPLYERLAKIPPKYLRRRS
jgi:hypothetical protein